MAKKQPSMPRHCAGHIDNAHVGDKKAFGTWVLIYTEDGESKSERISERVAHVLIDNGMAVEG